MANIALDMGMTVYGYDPYLSVNAAWRVSRHVIRVDDLDTLLRNCDYITLHTPLTDETRCMINAARIAKMKDGVRIINYARGEVVDEDAIIDALHSGKVERFVTDFPTARLIQEPKAILTPHLGGTTVEAEANCARMAARKWMITCARATSKTPSICPTCTWTVPAPPGSASFTAICRAC